MTFYVKLEKLQSKTLEVLKTVHGESTMSKTNTFSRINVLEEAKM